MCSSGRGRSLARSAANRRSGPGCTGWRSTCCRPSGARWEGPGPGLTTGKARQSAGREKHLATCEACTATLEDLRRVVVRARGLEDREPSTDLWRGIAKRIANDEQENVVAIESRRRPGGLFLSRWQLAAAAVVL